MKKVLITGMSGLIGKALRNRMEELGGYQLSALNRSKVEGVPCHRADIADLAAIKPAFQDIDVVVHLSAYGGTDNNWDAQLSANIIGTYNVYEAARLAGVKRVVFASSGMTIRGFTRVEPYKAITEGRYEDVPETWPMITHDAVRPDGLHGVVKVWGEALGRHYSDAYNISILCVRIGLVSEEDRPSRVVTEWTDPAQGFSHHLSQRDCADILVACVDAPDDLKYDIFFATSDNKWNYRDLEHPKQVLGWMPKDRAEDYR